MKRATAFTVFVRNLSWPISIGYPFLSQFIFKVCAAAWKRKKYWNF